MPSAKEIIDETRREIVNEIIENMKKGYIFSEERWNKEALRPQNPTSNTKYQGVNRLRLAYQSVKKGYKDPRWLTYVQAVEKGWKIKKNEKGTLCEKWIWTELKEIEDENGKIEKVEVDRKKPIVKYFVVFNGEQVEGIPEFEKKELSNHELLDVANKLIKSSECPIREIAQEKSYYSPSNDEIVLPLRGYFKSEESFLATLLHEMAHSTGHETRLNRNILNLFGTSDYAKEELRAELASIFLESDLNLDLKNANKVDHVNYLKSWISVLEDNPDELFKACNDSSKISERIVDNYERYIEIEKCNNYIDLVVLKDEIYGKNSLWRIPVNKFNQELRGEYLKNLKDEELKEFNGYIKDNNSTSLIYNNLLEYLEENKISFDELIDEEIEELVGGS